MRASMLAIAIAAVATRVHADNASEIAKQTAKYDEVKPLPPAIQDQRKAVPQAQVLLRPAFADAMSDRHPAPTFLRGYVMEGDWMMIRNPTSGVITGRTIKAVILYKGGQSGFCRYEWTSIFQPEQGGNTFGKPSLSSINAIDGMRVRFGSNGQRFDCAEATKLPQT